jgi:hypothetical protein
MVAVKKRNNKTTDAVSSLELDEVFVPWDRNKGKTKRRFLEFQFADRIWIRFRLDSFPSSLATGKREVGEKSPEEWIICRFKYLPDWFMQRWSTYTILCVCSLAFIKIHTRFHSSLHLPNGTIWDWPLIEFELEPMRKCHVIQPSPPTRKCRMLLDHEEWKHRDKKKVCAELELECFGTGFGCTVNWLWWGGFGGEVIYGLNFKHQKWVKLFDAQSFHWCSNIKCFDKSSGLLSWSGASIGFLVDRALKSKSKFQQVFRL